MTLQTVNAYYSASTNEIVFPAAIRQPPFLSAAADFKARTSTLAEALRAYHMSLGGKPAPVIDGFTGDQRVFLGSAHVWRQDEG